jgi:hypothetical protein
MATRTLSKQREYFDLKASSSLIYLLSHFRWYGLHIDLLPTSSVQTSLLPTDRVFNTRYDLWSWSIAMTYNHVTIHTEQSYSTIKDFVVLFPLQYLGDSFIPHLCLHNAVLIALSKALNIQKTPER